MIPFISALTFSTLLILVSAISAIILCIRWYTMLLNEEGVGPGDMKISTFYAAESKSESAGEKVVYTFCMPIVGAVFGGIHCVGWFFTFPSSAEAMLWRVSSAVVTGIAFLLPFIFFISVILSSRTNQRPYFAVAVLSIFLVVYLVSRLLLLVEAFISLRHLTPGMLALVKWTSFIPHI